MARLTGRGATENKASGRFNLPAREEDGDWRDARETVDGAPPRLATQVTVETPRTIIARNSSPDVPFDRSINPYRGCEQWLTALDNHIGVVRPICGCDKFMYGTHHTRNSPL